MTNHERDAVILAEYSRLFGDSEACHNSQTDDENDEIAVTQLDEGTTQNTGRNGSRDVSAE